MVDLTDLPELIFPVTHWKSLFSADIDECQTNQFNCPVNEDCVNTAGSYVCNCVSGVFDGVGVCQLMTSKPMGNVREKVWCLKQREPAGGLYGTSFLTQYKLQPEGPEKNLPPQIHFKIFLVIVAPRCGIAFLVRLGARNPSGRSNEKSIKLPKAWWYSVISTIKS